MRRQRDGEKRGKGREMTGKEKERRADMRREVMIGPEIGWRKYSRLSNRLYNRFDNGLYRVNGVLHWQRYCKLECRAITLPM